MEMSFWYHGIDNCRDLISATAGLPVDEPFPAMDIVYKLADSAVEMKG